MPSSPWTASHAATWNRNRPWALGFNYIPSSAVNTTEFWQAETFDRRTIARELGWAAAAGFNCCRVFIQELVWEADPDGFKQRFAEFLGLAAAAGLAVMPTLFDDCAFNRAAPFLGKQPEPIPGRMMTGWTASPGHARVLDRSQWPALERYVRDLVSSFGADPRINVWDLYNEPGNEGIGDGSLPLVEAAFAWARAAAPTQPLTVALWNLGSPAFTTQNELLLRESDVITFHHYGDLDSTRAILDRLATHGRPVLCTEWMARPLGSRIASHLPLLRERCAGGYVWGLVNGRTQTQYPWEFLRDKVDGGEWFHDLFYRDGTPYAPAEIALLRGAAQEL